MLLAMESSSRYGRSSHSNSFKQKRSGYEPSDTETEWQDSPWHDLKNEPPTDVAFIADRPKTPARYISPLGRSKRYSSTNHDYTSSITSSKPSPAVPRRNSKSPYRPRTDHSHHNAVSPKHDTLDARKNISPFSKSERTRPVSPYNSTRGEVTRVDASSIRKQNHRVAHKYVDAEEVAYSREVSRVSERSYHSRRAISAPKPRPKEKIEQVNKGSMNREVDRNPSPISRSLVRKQREAHHIKAPSASEMNEIIGMAKASKGNNGAVNTEAQSSIEPGDIFFSREYAAFATEKAILPSKKDDIGGNFLSRPDHTVTVPIPKREIERIRVIIPSSDPNNHEVPLSTPDMVAIVEEYRI